MKRSFIVLSIVLLAGCGVSKEKYTALQDQMNGCQQNLTVAQTARSTCEIELASLSESKETLEDKTRTYEDLVSSLEGEIKAGKVKISEMKNRLTVNLIDKILFDSGKTELKTEGQGALEKVSEVLKGVEGKQIQVEGHTDDVPLGPTLQRKFPTNWELSTARAAAVVRFLADHGVSKTTLSATGYSMYAPVASNETDDGKRQNRRIEIVLVPATEEKPAPAEKVPATAPEVEAPAASPEKPAE